MLELGAEFEIQIQGSTKFEFWLQRKKLSLSIGQVLKFAEFEIQIQCSAKFEF